MEREERKTDSIVKHKIDRKRIIILIPLNVPFIIENFPKQQKNIFILRNISTTRNFSLKHILFRKIPDNVRDIYLSEILHITQIHIRNKILNHPPDT